MTPEAQAVTLQHPAIGSIKGTQYSPRVEEYRGIKYATLTDRFARGQLVENYPSTLDATSHGFVLHPPFAVVSSLPSSSSPNPSTVPSPSQTPRTATSSNSSCSTPFPTRSTSSATWNA